MSGKELLHDLAAIAAGIVCGCLAALLVGIFIF